MLSFLGVSPFRLHQPTILSTKLGALDLRPRVSASTTKCRLMSAASWDERRKSARYCLREAMKTRMPLSTPSSFSSAPILPEMAVSRSSSGLSPDSNVRSSWSMKSAIWSTPCRRARSVASRSSRKFQRSFSSSVLESSPWSALFEPPLESGADLRLDLRVDLFPFRARRVHLVPDGKDIGTVRPRACHERSAESSSCRCRRRPRRTDGTSTSDRARPALPSCTEAGCPSERS